MYHVLSKRGVLFGIFFIFVILFSAFILFRNGAAIFSSALPQNRKPTIVIDPGHGGVDPGAIGANGVNEKEINLAIALNLRDILTVNGYRVVMIRTQDVSVNDPSITKIVPLKTSDIMNRMKLIDSYPDALTIMIHQNEFGKNCHGAQMFYGRKNAQSKPLAQSLQEKFRLDLQPDNMREIKESSSHVYLVHNAKSPIVLVECGFISNPAECVKLCDAEYQKKAAFTIFHGISAYRDKAEN